MNINVPEIIFNKVKNQFSLERWNRDFADFAGMIVGGPLEHTVCLKHKLETIRIKNVRNGSGFFPFSLKKAGGWEGWRELFLW